MQNGKAPEPAHLHVELLNILNKCTQKEDILNDQPMPSLYLKKVAEMHDPTLEEKLSELRRIKQIYSSIYTSNVKPIQKQKQPSKIS